jgi:hypothetical protein
MVLGGQESLEMKQQKITILSLVLAAGWFGVPRPAPAYELDPGNRWQIRDYYNTIYPYFTGAGMDWTGNYAAGTAGTIGADWQEAVRVRVNFYRRMAGLGNEIILDPALSAMCQEAALMMSVNGRLSHNPLPAGEWTYWTADGYAAAQNGNLSLGTAGPEAVDGYMADFGTPQYPDWNNTVGHRRWILFPQTLVMGNGDVPGDSSAGLREANTLWVFPEEIGPRPPTRDDFVAWPPRGYVPNTLVWSRWSLSYPNADFSNATVSMTSGGQSLPVAIEDFVFLNNYFPESTLVWRPNGMGTTEYETWPAPDGDETVHVSIQNVIINGIARSFEYSVVIFDPEVADAAETESEVVAQGLVQEAIPAWFTVSSRDWSEGVQGRILTAKDHEINYGAENGVNPFIISKTGNYSTIQSVRKASGDAAFLMGHTTPPEAQTLTFPDEFIVTGNAASLGFSSSLAWASSAQSAHVDVKVGSENNWQSIWSQSGPVLSNHAFDLLHLDLTPYADRTIRIRFRYEHAAGGLYYPTGDGHVGWAIDDVHLAGVQCVTSSNELPPQWDSNQFNAVFTNPGPHFVQARELAFGGFPLEWGHVVKVDVQEGSGIEIPIGEWQDNPFLGWTYAVNDLWKYSLTTGYTFTDDFPWIYTQCGWIQYLQGTVYDGLWFYHPVYGYCYTRYEYGGWFIHSPYAEDSWKRFFP